MHSVKVSKEKSDLYKKLRALKKLPKSEETDALIVQTRRDYLGASGSTVDGSTYYYQSFECKFQSDGSKVIVVYEKEDTDDHWSPYTINTFMTDEQASAFLGYAVEDTEAYHCEFYGSGWISNDDSQYTDNDGDFHDDASLRASLGLTNAKGYWQSGDPVFVSPSEILRGQKIVITYDINQNNEEDEFRIVIDKIIPPNFDIAETNPLNIILVIFFIFFIFMYFLKCGCLSSLS